MAKNNQLNLIARVKMLRVGFINKCILNSEIGGEEGLFSNSYLLTTFLKYLSINPRISIIFRNKI